MHKAQRIVPVLIMAKTGTYFSGITKKVSYNIISATEDHISGSYIPLPLGEGRVRVKFVVPVTLGQGGVNWRKRLLTRIVI